MRCSVYNFLLGLSDSIVEAIEYMISGNTLTLIPDCVDACTAVKNGLESNGEKCSEVDDFLEIINKVVKATENRGDGLEYLPQLKEFAYKIKEFCHNNLTYKFKIVFFAELGAKWDAMDSVYRAFMEKEDCEVSVVLAPIFRAVKLESGEVKSDILYTDYLTPMGIEHIPYSNYDIKKDLPDIVFTSQPYESVTPEQFWAQNIAPYTHLVYLPYFTTDMIDDDETIYTHCQMPMHNLAWKIICQSEELGEFYKKHMQNGGKNLVSLGLPKWDYVVNMDKREVELPKGWEKIKGKKVILFNVHYTTKPKDMFDIVTELLNFAENEGYSVIFRFHPMAETMFKVYLLEYADEWNKIKGNIINSKNCVIDEEFTYEAAFKFSDFLYSSNFSSLVPQYLLTKKPVILCTKYNTLKREERLEAKKSIFIRYFNLRVPCEKEDLFEKIKYYANGLDEGRETRLKLINEYMPNADGKIGEKVADYLVSELKKENI